MLAVKVPFSCCSCAESYHLSPLLCACSPHGPEPSLEKSVRAASSALSPVQSSACCCTERSWGLNPDPNGTQSENIRLKASGHVFVPVFPESPWLNTVTPF